MNGWMNWLYLSYLPSGSEVVSKCWKFQQWIELNWILNSGQQSAGDRSGLHALVSVNTPVSTAHQWGGKATCSRCAKAALSSCWGTSWEREVFFVPQVSRVPEKATQPVKPQVLISGSLGTWMAGEALWEGETVKTTGIWASGDGVKEAVGDGGAQPLWEPGGGVAWGMEWAARWRCALDPNSEGPWMPGWGAYRELF